MYDYREAIKEDIKEYIKDNDIEVTDDNRDEIVTKLNDDLWCEDSVTGNASGSYTFNSYKAKEYVLDNMELLEQAMSDFGEDDAEIGKRFLNEEWEYMDVSIRCWLLGEMIEEAIDEIIEEQDICGTGERT